MRVRVRAGVRVRVRVAVRVRVRVGVRVRGRVRVGVRVRVAVRVRVRVRGRVRDRLALTGLGGELSVLLLGLLAVHLREHVRRDLRPLARGERFGGVLGVSLGEDVAPGEGEGEG